MFVCDTKGIGSIPIAYPNNIKKFLNDRIFLMVECYPVKVYGIGSSPIVIVYFNFSGISGSLIMASIVALDAIGEGSNPSFLKIGIIINFNKK